MRSRVLLVANTAWYLYNFRLPLLNYLRMQEFAVELVAPPDPYFSLLEKAGFNIHPWKINRASLNPWLEAQALLDLIRIYQETTPDLVHHFTIKACLYGTLAAKATNTHHVINAITGLGHVFLGEGKQGQVLRWLLRPLYRAVFTARRSVVVFQNADDQDLLVSLGITQTEKSFVISSSGVDTERFDPSIIATLPKAIPRVLFPSRLIREKGVIELLQAVEILRQKGHKFYLVVAGEIDLGNRSVLSAAELQKLQSDPNIICLGHLDDIRPELAAADLVVLPSYREGLSRALIEAAAMEKAIVTTDVPGCRDVVDNGRTGLLVALKDPPGLARAMEVLLLNPDLCERMGKCGRQKVLQQFEVAIVNHKTLDLYHQILDVNRINEPALA